LNPFFAKKVNPFFIKSEPIRILYPFHSPFTIEKGYRKVPFFYWRFAGTGRTPFKPREGAKSLQNNTRLDFRRQRQQKTHFCLPTKVRFLNDVCLRQMMTASPNDVRFANDAWLRHILEQTSQHCDRREQHHFERSEKHHIAAGDASFDNQAIS